MNVKRNNKGKYMKLLKFVISGFVKLNVSV